MGAAIWSGLDLDALAARGVNLTTEEAVRDWMPLLAYALEAREVLRGDLEVFENDYHKDPDGSRARAIRALLSLATEEEKP